MKLCASTCLLLVALLARGLIVLALGMAMLWGFAFAGEPANVVTEQRFASPEDAVKALTATAKARDTNAMRAMFGPAAHDLISPDLVQATEEYEIFLRQLSEKVEQVRASDSTITLRIGADGWPFPIPLVSQGGQWHFDTEAGKEEVLTRRIGMDEMGAIDVSRAYVDAQREYASKDRNGDEVLEYAQHLRSTPGTRDGLYWPPQPGEDLSPLGPLVAQAWGEGYRHHTRILTEEPRSPYHGYYFKILSKQGKHAPGGKYNYISNNHMIGGFALVAWPAEWGVSGVMTLIVNQQGKIYEKNLGPKTSSIASGMTTYDPDSTWTLVKEE